MTTVAQGSSNTQKEHPRILPDDEHNRILTGNTHPSNWVNPEPAGRYNLVVIGSGTAGLTAAGGCAAVGGRVALIERHMTGGDCLISGCVPSKAIIHSARVAAAINRSGVSTEQASQKAAADFPAVMERMRKLRARISPADSVHHLKETGVDVYLGQGQFTGTDTIEVDGKRLRFARAVIDEEGHLFPRNVAIAVCTDTASKFSQAPYAGQFTILEPDGSAKEIAMAACCPPGSGSSSCC